MTPASAASSLLEFGPAANPEIASTIAFVDGITGQAEWTKYRSQQSAPIPLEAGHRYYLETLQVAWGRDGFINVGWAGAGLSDTNIIAPSFLSPVDIEYAPELTPLTVQLDSASPNGTLVTTLAGTDSPADTLAYRIISGNVSNTFALDLVSGELRVADRASLATHALTNFDLVVQVQDSGYGGLYPLKTAEATIHVEVLTTDTAVWSGNGTDDNWSTGNNWVDGLPKDNDSLLFGWTNRQTNRNDLLTSIRTVSLEADNLLLWGDPLILTDSLQNSGYNNGWAIDLVLNRQVRFRNTAGRLTIAGAISGRGGLVAELWDLLSPQGGSPGELVLLATNRYTGPTIITLGTLILSNAAAIAASADVDVQSMAALDVRGVPGTFTILPGQTLRGNGRVLGSVIVTGTLAPTVLPLPPPNWLTFSNGLILAGKTVLPIVKSVNQSGAIFTNSIRVSGELVCGGSLVVTNWGVAPAIGDTFVLFEAETFSGSFADLTFPQLAPGLRWDASRLTRDGMVQVVPTLVRIRPLPSAEGLLSFEIATAPGTTYLLESTASLGLGSLWSPTPIVFAGTGRDPHNKCCDLSQSTAALVPLSRSGRGRPWTASAAMNYSRQG